MQPCRQEYDTKTTATETSVCTEGSRNSAPAGPGSVSGQRTKRWNFYHLLHPSNYTQPPPDALSQTTNFGVTLLDVTHCLTKKKKKEKRITCPNGCLERLQLWLQQCHCISLQCVIRILWCWETDHTCEWPVNDCAFNDRMLLHFDKYIFHMNTKTATKKERKKGKACTSRSIFQDTKEKCMNIFCRCLFQKRKASYFCKLMKEKSEKQWRKF